MNTYGFPSLSANPPGRAFAWYQRLTAACRRRDRALAVNQDMRRALRAVACIVATWLAAPLPARAGSEDYAVQLSATFRRSPAEITVAWTNTDAAAPLSYSVQRKRAGETAWGPAVVLPGSATQYSDASVETGSAYEYQVVRSMPTYSAYGYIQSGIDVPVADSRGKLILIVERGIAASLTAEIARLEQDLLGDGWLVVRREVGRTDPVTSVKALIATDYTADPGRVKAVFLLGHVPVPYAGRIAPDGHADHLGAWPADVYYGDVDGGWTDQYVDFIQPSSARLTNVPGDGKFDQPGAPTSVELPVGRVDLANLPGRVGGVPTFASETELLRQYLDKNHAFRHGTVTAQRRAVVGDYFGPMNGEAFAASGYRSFAPLVGPTEIVNLNSQYGSAGGVWLPTLAASTHLLAYGCGPGTFTSIGGIGSTTELVQQDVRSVFTLLCGSYFGDWDTEDNVLRAPLATRDGGLVSLWSGRPHWYLHPMGLGETIGYVARLVQNNGAGQYRNQLMTANGLVSVALMGDPTLRLHPVLPASGLTGTIGTSGVDLTWARSPDSVVGYHVYRSESPAGPFTRVTSAPVTEPHFTDAAGSTGLTYMVRAVKSEVTPSGSYLNASQGVFWATGGVLPDRTAPAVGFLSPAADTVVSGNAVVIAVQATDNVGLAGVQFQIDGQPFGTEIAATPYTITWDSTGVADGVHALTAVARDAAGNRATTTISIQTKNATAPVVTAAPPVSATGEGPWIDDALPKGALMFASGGDGWRWVSESPLPISGTKAHQSGRSPGFQEHGFADATTSLPVRRGDTLYAYVHLDPSNPPSEIMLSWQAGTWEHRAYWGVNRIDAGRPGTGSRRHMGRIPAAGQWVRLEVPAASVDLEGRTVTGMSFSLFGGRATWDSAGRTAAP